MKKFLVKEILNYPTYTHLKLVPKNRSDTLHFQPGQYAAICFVSHGRPTPMRCFSMVSAPMEGESLEFGFRITGKFTSALSQLSVGEEVRLEGPFGDFVVDPTYDKHIVCIAGGIGVTPFVSIVRAATQAESGTTITLLYSCRSQADIPFFDELLSLQRANPRFHVVFYISDGVIQPRNGAVLVSGKIDEKCLEQIVDRNFQGKTYFLCGPEGFMNTLSSQIKAHGVDPSAILTESFAQSGGLRFQFWHWQWGVSKLAYTFTSLALLAGIGFIAAIDLKGYLPKATTSITQPTTNTPAITSPSSDDDQDENTTTPSNDSTTPTPQPNPSYSAPTTQQYTTPTTRVS